MAAQPQQGVPVEEMSAMSLQGSVMAAGDTALLSQFVHNTVISLESIVTGASLCICGEQVQGKGNREQRDAQFTVHVSRPGVISLQNVQNPEAWLAVYNGEINGSGSGGPYCEFLVKEVEGKFVSLESAMYPGHVLGLQEDGTVKAPTETRASQRESWLLPYPHNEVLPSSDMNPPSYSEAVSSYVPPIVPVPIPVGGGIPGYPQAPPQGYPQAYPQGYRQAPPQGYPQAPPQGYPQAPSQGYPQGYPQAPPQGYPQYPSVAPGAPVGAPGYMAYTQQQVAQGPCSPYGYNIMDVFQNDNIIRLIPRIDPHKFPIKVNFPTLAFPGNYVQTDSEFVISVVTPGVVRLKNVHWAACYVYINTKGYTGADGKDGDHPSCHFRVHVFSGNCVAFESMLCNGWFLCMRRGGGPGDPRKFQATHPETQFYVRVERMTKPHSATIMTPFGRPSIVNSIRDRNLIQLYVNLSGTKHYLIITKKGRVEETQNPKDKQSYFIFVDRGLGMVSLVSYCYRGYRLRFFDYRMQGMGEPNMNADFLLKEHQDGSVCFESVTYPGTLVTTSGRHFGKLSTFRVVLLNIEKQGKLENVTTYPLN